MAQVALQYIATRKTLDILILGTRAALEPLRQPTHSALSPMTTMQPSRRCPQPERSLDLSAIELSRARVNMTRQAPLSHLPMVTQVSHQPVLLRLGPPQGNCPTVRRTQELSLASLGVMPEQKNALPIAQDARPSRIGRQSRTSTIFQIIEASLSRQHAREGTGGVYGVIALLLLTLIIMHTLSLDYQLKSFGGLQHQAMSPGHMHRMPVPVKLGCISGFSLSHT